MTFIANTDPEREAMLDTIGIQSLDDLWDSIPASIRLNRPLDVPPALDEQNLVRHLQWISDENLHIDRSLSFLGSGIYDHYCPSVVVALAGRGEFATAYTPYQPEVSQGMLQAMYEFQSLICALTGMEMANASMYDGATALAEAALMAVEITGRTKVAISNAVHPHYRQVLKTYLQAAGYEMSLLPTQNGITDEASLEAVLNDPPACLIGQQPNFFGCIENLSTFTKAASQLGALSIIAVDPFSLALLKPPGDFGVDVVVGEGQSLGLPTGFGGPLLGIFACKREYARRLPGRIVGATTDSEGRRGYVMTLRTREQDIRREKATSNICTNEALMALMASIYLAALGKEGLQETAAICVQKAHYLQERLQQELDLPLLFKAGFFCEFAISLPLGADELNRRLLEKGIIGGYNLRRRYPQLPESMLICVTETKSRDDLDRFVEAMKDCLK